MASGPAGGNGDADFRRQLATEITAWRRDGLIAADQAQAILRRYEPFAGATIPVEQEPGDDEHAVPTVYDADRATLVSRAVSVIGVMGALLVGLGIIIYVAANWDVIPIWARVTMLVALTTAINVAGWLLLSRFGYPRIGVALLLAGALAYGAAVHLIAQIYHVPVNHPNLTAAWFLGVLPMGYVVRSRLMVAVSLALLVLSMGFRTQWWLEYYGAETFLFLAPLTLALSAAVVALGRLQSRFDWTRPLAAYCYYPGVVIGFIAFGAMTVASIWVDVGKLTWEVLSAEYWITAGAGIATAVVAAGALWRVERAREDARPLAHMAEVTTLIVAVAATWLWLAYPEPIMWWLFNLVALGGVAAVAFFNRSLVLLAGAAALFLLALGLATSLVLDARRILGCRGRSIVPGGVGDLSCPVEA